MINNTCWTKEHNLYFWLRIFIWKCWTTKGGMEMTLGKQQENYWKYEITLNYKSSKLE